MSDRTLLPSNASAAETALEGASARISDVPVPLRSLWQPETCPAHLLPWLAWALSVDEWDQAWPDEQKRAVVAQSVSIHQRKGTRAAVRDALRSAGYGEAEIVEDFGFEKYDGIYTHDGSRDHQSGDHWAEYRVIMQQSITIEQGEQVRRILSDVAPLRCHLAALDFARAANLYNGRVSHDGQYSHGVV